MKRNWEKRSLKLMASVRRVDIYGNENCSTTLTMKYTKPIDCSWKCRDFRMWSNVTGKKTLLPKILKLPKMSQHIHTHTEREKDRNGAKCLLLNNPIKRFYWTEWQSHIFLMFLSCRYAHNQNPVRSTKKKHLVQCVKYIHTNHTLQPMGNKTKKEKGGERLIVRSMSHWTVRSLKPTILCVDFVLFVVFFFPFTNMLLRVVFSSLLLFQFHFEINWMDKAVLK